MWFKRKKREEEDKEEKTETQYISGDTPLGQHYNKALNKRFSQSMYSDALSYEMLRQVDRKADLYGERLVMFEARVAKLEKATAELKAYTDTPQDIESTEANPRKSHSIHTAKDYDANAWDFIYVHAVDGPVTVSLPKAEGKRDNIEILVEKRDHSANVVTVIDKGQYKQELTKENESIRVIIMMGGWSTL